MKTLDEIMSNKRIMVIQKGIDGFKGIIQMPMWSGTIICSTGCGWNHVSVCPEKKRIIPSWDDMCLIKEICWNDDEAVIQIHPPKEEYVNNMPNCLHLWQCAYKEMVLPPSCLVGIKKGQTMAEVREEIKKAYEMAGEKYE